MTHATEPPSPMPILTRPSSYEEEGCVCFSLLTVTSKVMREALFGLTLYLGDKEEALSSGIDVSMLNGTMEDKESTIKGCMHHQQTMWVCDI